ncbi:MAG: UDP-N-acetylglucosamine 2-epimerase (non-hydrolyzing) [Candidatus Adiutrix sp.]|jgi:UDP-N-acetylglucosamine 2-epimerase|nr:UDP-N-acetylglucosamine 2-epimerase (non-hydrolyzing) [Candidatus Adiutrix sp.]
MAGRIKILTVVGARPQFIKAAMVSRALAAASDFQDFQEEIIHTGQHWDPAMSEVFFKHLGLPEPAARLELGGGPHGRMTGRMLEALEGEMLKRRPDLALVYGDTNSTLAGALAAAKLGLPVAHVEAGLRSFNRAMPEEINRVLTDHLAARLFCPTRTAVANLEREGLRAGVHLVGDVMYDAALFFGATARRDSRILEALGLTDKSFLLVTVHRQENTDDPARLEALLTAFQRLAAAGETLVWPLHPRLKGRLAGRLWPKGLRLIEPLPFLDMTRLEMGARVILTDSGGVQKEAYFQQTPCVTLRGETEWVETVAAGWNQPAGFDPGDIERAVARAAPGRPIDEYGDGHSGRAIARLLAAG